jgi:excinuclease UvrABC nuclease subunit
MPINIVELSSDDIVSLANSDLDKKTSAIYFLIDSGEIVYIGRSHSVYDRLKAHLLDKTKIFQSWVYFPVKLSELDAVEKQLIAKHLPRHNIKHNKNRSYKDRFTTGVSVNQPTEKQTN